MKDFRKTAGAAGLFALIYTFCMYKNTASITFPLLMAVGIWLLYVMQDKRKLFDSKLSSFYIVGITLIAVSVFMTGDWKLILMSKMAVLVLYICLAMDIYFDDGAWDDLQHVYHGIKIVLGSIGKGFNFLSDYGEYKKERKIEGAEDSFQKKQIVKVLKGVLIALPLLVIIIPLMMSADVVFQNMVRTLFDLDMIFEILFEKINIIGLGITFLASFLLYYGFLKVTGEENGEEQLEVKTYGDKITGITITGIIGFIYVIFSMIQLRGIFFSNVKLPEGYTYAEYAREGFFQLFILAVINMVIVLICAARYEYDKILNIILYVLCACTYVMIFSSAWKMILYIRVYNLTFLRVMVLWSLAVLAVIMAAVIRYVYSDDFSLFKFMAVVVTSFYIIAAFARPDYVVAKYNLDYGNQTEVDRHYLFDLSSDAFPVIMEHKEDLNCTLNDRYFLKIKEKYDDMGIRTFNLSGFIAKSMIQAEE